MVDRAVDIRAFYRTVVTVIVRRYRREVLPAKAPRTRRDNENELARLDAVFGQVPMDAIQPSDVRTYMDIRGQTAKVRANREKSLLPHVFSHIGF